MIALSADMIFSAVACATVIGVILGAIYAFFCGMSALFSRIIKLRDSREEEDKEGVGILVNVFDFLFTVFAGMVYIVLTYVFTEGAFSAYSLLAYLIGFLLGKSIILRILTIPCRHKH